MGCEGSEATRYKLPTSLSLQREVDPRIQYQYNVRLGRTDSLPDRKPQEMVSMSVMPS